MTLREAVAQSLLLNELSGNESAAYQLSAAKGGTSGWSFGRTQLDASNNSTAVKCLAECGYTPGEIADIRAKAGDRHALSAKLAQHKEIVDRYDAAQIDECLNHVMLVAKSRRITFANDEAIVHLADYHNQFYLQTAGKMANFLAGLGRAVTAGDIYGQITHTVWGQKDPDDVKRRYNNIARLMGGALI